MKKIIALLIGATIAGFVPAQQIDYSTSIRSIGDTVSTTNGVTTYVGLAKAYPDASTPSTNAAVWKILRSTYDTNGYWTGTSTAYGSALGDKAAWSTAWTNRAATNTVYK